MKNVMNIIKLGNMKIEEIKNHLEKLSNEK